VKTICILRHAEAAVDPLGINDINRFLTDAGIAAAIRLSYKIKGRDLNFDQVLVSTAKRGVQTFEYLNKVLEIDDENVILKKDIYSASLANLLKIINQLDNSKQTILMIGHNPALSLLASALEKNSAEIHLPPCGIIQINFEIDFWHEASEIGGVQAWVDFPK
jgi:phosphohistidine phosphatase